MNKQRLEALRDVLIDVRDRSLPFDMSFWVRGETPDPYDCGTAACALGWFARSPVGRRDGWELLIADDADADFYPVWEPLRRSGWHGVGAAARYFEIDKGSAASLFYPETYPGGRTISIDQVLDRVKRVLGGEQLVPTYEDEVSGSTWTPALVTCRSR